jgi:hypothetical protein
MLYTFEIYVPLSKLTFKPLRTLKNKLFI